MINLIEERLKVINIRLTPEINSLLKSKGRKFDITDDGNVPVL